jgi:hypothetical protein
VNLGDSHQPDSPFALILGHPDDSVLKRLGFRLREKGLAAFHIGNVAGAGVSLPIGVDGMEAWAKVSGHELPIGRAKACVLSCVLSKCWDPLSPSNAAYIEQESHAAWLALLYGIPCRMLNRPSASVPVWMFSSLQIRSIVRTLGIPTADDRICNGRTLESGRPKESHIACIDLSNHRRFWLDGDYTLSADQMYAVVSVPVDPMYDIIVRVGNEFFGYTWELGAQTAQELSPVADSLIENTRRLLCALELEYAYCFYSRVERTHTFTSLQTYAPSFLGPQAELEVAECLLDWMLE